MGKYLRKPTIFEIATAFESGQEGMLHPQNDGDGYKKVYGQLNERERILTYRHPILAMKIKKNREKAFEATSRFPGLTDGYGDAIRHCYWCALNQMDAGLNSSDAKEFGDAHEYGSSNDSKAKTMDLHNNSVGYHLGNEAIVNGWGEEELLHKVINAANNGILKIIK